MFAKIKVFLQNNPRTISVFLAFFILGLGSYALLARQNQKNSEPVAAGPAPSVEPFVELGELVDIDAFNILLLGYGGAGHDGGFLTDVIMLVHVNVKDRVVGLISIPRDLWVTLPSGRQGKINAAFIQEDAPQYPTEDVSLEDALTGAQKTKSVIEQVTGLEPHFFIGIDFNRFVSVIDQLDGVDVDVPGAFEDPWYPIKGRELELCGLSPEKIASIHQKYKGFELERQFACRYEEISFAKGQMHMNGETALKFVRSRHGTSGGDFDRSMRQQAVMVGVRDALLSKKALSNPVSLYKTLNKSVQTNLNENLVKAIAALATNLGSYEVKRINLTTENVLQDARSLQGAFILIPVGGSWDSVQSHIDTQLSTE